MNSLNDFYLTTRNLGFSKDYLGKVSLLDFSYLALDQKLKEQYILNPTYLVYVKEFTLPGIKVEETTLKLQDFLYKSTGQTIYNATSLDITFYSDQFLYLRDFFETVIKQQSIYQKSVEAGGAAEVGAVGPAEADSIVSPNYDTNLVFEINLEDIRENKNILSTPGVEMGNYPQPAYTFDIKGVSIIGLEQATYSKAGPGNIQELKVKFSFNSYLAKPGPYTPRAVKYAFDQRTPTIPSTNNSSPEAKVDAPKTNVLGSIINGLNAIRGIAQGVGGAAGAVGGATREIRATRQTIRGR